MPFDLELLRSNPVIALFLILGLGVAIGRIRIKGIQLGSVTGVLFVGLLAGHLGISLPGGSMNIGFTIFIYAVGVQAGPRVLSTFKEDGPKYLVISLVTATSATLLAGILAYWLDLAPGAGAGMLAGALTSTPTLVAAQDAVAQGVELPAGLTKNNILQNISSAYAITYVFGMAGLILFISVLPRVARIDIAKEAREAGKGGDDDPLLETRPPDLPIRAYRIENRAVTENTFGSRDFAFPVEFQKIKRGEEVFVPEEDTRLEIGDVVSIVGPKWIHEKAREILGPEILDNDILDRSMESRRAVVSSSAVVGNTLKELDFHNNHQVWLTQVSRGGVDLPRRPDLKLQLGDVLTMTGARSNLDAAADRLGYSEVRILETDLVSFALGIALGLLIGVPTITIGQTSIGLGSAGGVLISGLFMGWVHARRPDIGRLPYSARSILMELGLLLFMAQVAVSAGATVVETFQAKGVSLALCGAAITIIPVLLSFAVGRYLLRMNGAILLGAITGSMTSTAALQQVNDQAKSSVPMMGYVGTYALANILLAMAGALMMRF